jgi:GT2 family glycosyltransferase
VKLFIGIPSSGAPAQPFLDSFATLDIPRSVTSVDRAIVTGNYVPAQRELLVRRALERDADVMLMCDDDMVIPKDALSKLLELLEREPDCGLAGALYYSRDGFRPMAVDHWDPNNTTSANIPAFDAAPVDVDGVGFGCVVLRLDAVRAMTAPLFPAHVYIEPAASRVRVCDEDYLFCSRLREHGFRVVLHAGVRCGHYDRASRVVFPQQWEDSSITSHARIAVADAGMPKLVPFTHVQESKERHERAALTYIWPEN